MLPTRAFQVQQTETEPVTVAVTSYQTALAAALVPTLASLPDLRILPATEAESADVLLVLTDSVTDQVLVELEQAAAIAEQPGHCIVLVSDPLRERQLARVLAAGVVVMLSRRQANAQTVQRAILAGHEGRPVLPDAVVRWLVDDFRTLREKMLEPLGLHHGGLTEREVEVLRLLAEGESTAAMAERMNYSQRTIKKIIQELLTRLDLKNRSHAVSYAMRVGAI